MLTTIQVMEKKYEFAFTVKYRDEIKVHATMLHKKNPWLTLIEQQCCLISNNQV